MAFFYNNKFTIFAACASAALVGVFHSAIPLVFSLNMVFIAANIVPTVGLALATILAIGVIGSIIYSFLSNNPGDGGGPGPVQRLFLWLFGGAEQGEEPAAAPAAAGRAVIAPAGSAVIAPAAMLVGEPAEAAAAKEEGDIHLINEANDLTSPQWYQTSDGSLTFYTHKSGSVIVEF